MNEVKRTFVIGEEWLYYKIYAGPKTCERIILETIGPITRIFMDDKSIEKWFFIRYSDPDYHLRVRFKCTKLEDTFGLIRELSRSMSTMVNEDLIHRIQIDTYHREIERYGKDTIHLFEQLFFFDSQMVIQFFSNSPNIEIHDDRWLFGAKSINCILQLFGYSLKEKLSFTKGVLRSFGEEFRFDKRFKKQLRNKYQRNRLILEEFLTFQEEQNNRNRSFRNIIDIYSQDADNIILSITSITDASLLDSRIQSYLHMFLNRLFRSKNRLQEFVLYFMMERHYQALNGKYKSKL
ncbi:thiopeptide-type bacteriocin biosynthesis protein [Maribacter sp. 2307UL18-2]|uniref:thiopeptide-type bacteriocin biosynthesis protein n=1 Tax=Maribacter sp. 2307UL18-2 TaxID=3386274 RepID=UPI0039BCBEAB